MIGFKFRRLNTEMSSESSDDSNGVNQVLDTIDMNGNDELMTTEDNDSQALDQLVDEDMDLNEMIMLCVKRLNAKVM
ncbi:unnamed protein product [Medioppia subpectinata]|uniref:Uncharacterized protein n=1 Tax=Medioppia subpectinata TaxID=1979941 RepID=A0A7R9KHI5_9ACAR|nr:unnamed protein product [Medioppia subpectinata]CAG2103683.1 unnamed protein product [Medioppia subpectinata]